MSSVSDTRRMHLRHTLPPFSHYTRIYDMFAFFCCNSNIFSSSFLIVHLSVRRVAWIVDLVALVVGIAFDVETRVSLSITKSRKR